MSSPVPTNNPLLEFLRRYDRDSVLMVREVLGADPDPWQVEVLRAYDRRERNITIRSGHRVGKSTLLSWIALHHLLCRFPQKTLATAPTEAQLFDVLVAELHTWIKKLPESIQELLEVQTDRIALKFSPKESFFRARTARPEKPEAVQGMHSENVLVLCDEASGIDDTIFKAIRGSAAAENITTILTGNPLKRTGHFFDTHNKMRRKGGEDKRSGTWLAFHISSLDSKRVSREFIEEIREQYGENHNEWRIRVLGEFPIAEAEVIIPLDLIEPAVGRDIRVVATWREVWGLDVAAGGDDRSVLARRRVKVLVEKPRAWYKLESMQVVGKVKELWDSLPASERPAGIYIDAVIWGGGVAHRLAEMGLPAFAINVSEMPAVDPDRHKNIRTQLWFAAREWFRARDCTLPPGCESLIEELASQPYKIIDSTGKTLATPKKLVKKELGRSPDEGDAFILTFAHGTAADGGTGSNWSTPLARPVSVV